jgi:hypothetical protein
MAHGATSPVAIGWTFSTTAAPTRGDGVGVALALGDAGVVGMAIVVVRGEVPTGAAHDIARRVRTRAMLRRRVARASVLRASR